MSRSTPVAVFVMEIRALGTAAPEASVTVPARVAPATWAWTGVDAPVTSANIMPTNRQRLVTIEESLRMLLTKTHLVGEVAPGGATKSPSIQTERPSVVSQTCP